jgi:hypothetical protein
MYSLRDAFSNHGFVKSVLSSLGFTTTLSVRMRFSIKTPRRSTVIFQMFVAPL